MAIPSPPCLWGCYTAFNCWRSLPLHVCGVATLPSTVGDPFPSISVALLHCLPFSQLQKQSCCYKDHVFWCSSNLHAAASIYRYLWLQFLSCTQQQPPISIPSSDDNGKNCCGACYLTFLAPAFRNHRGFWAVNHMSSFSQSGCHKQPSLCRALRVAAILPHKLKHGSVTKD